MRSRSLILVGALLFAPLVACGDDPHWKDVKKEAGETWDALKVYGVAQREKAESGFAQGVASLESSWAQAKTAAAAKSADAGQALDARWRDVQGKLATLKSAGADRWAEARDEFVKAYEALKRDVSPAK